MRKNATKFAAFALSMAMAITCTNVPSASAATKTKLNATKKTLYAKGPSAKKSYTLKLTNGSKKYNATFKSSNKSVATVSESGKVTAQKAGTATITATYNKKPYTCKVTVKKSYTGVKLTGVPTKLTVTKGKTKKVTYKVTGTEKGVTFKTSKKSVATVSSTGTVKGVKAGTATITVTTKGVDTKGKKVSKTVKVTVKAPATTPSATPEATTTPSATPEATATSSAVATAAKQNGRNKILVEGATSTDVKDYEVKKGNNTVAVSEVALTEDGKSAILTTAQNVLSDGDYTVAYKAGTPLAFKCEKEKATTVKVVSEKLVAEKMLTNNVAVASCSATFAVLNQFNEKMSGTQIDSNSSVGSCVTTQATATKDGKVMVNIGDKSQTRVGDKVTLVLVEKNTGANVTAELTVGEVRKVAKVEALGVRKVDGSGDTAKVTEDSVKTNATAGDYMFLFKAKDQYGEDITPDSEQTSGDSKTKLFTKDNITISVAGPSGLAFATNEKGEAAWTVETVKVNGEDYLGIKFTSKDNKVGSIAGTTTLTVIGNLTGTLCTTTFDVVKNVELADFTFAPMSTIYNNREVECSYEATDTEGNKVTDYDTLVKGLKFNGQSGKMVLKEQADGSAKLFYQPSIDGFVADKEDDTSSLPSVVVTTIHDAVSGITTKVNSSTLTVYATPKISAISGLKCANATIATDGSIDLSKGNMKFEDQYGNELLTSGDAYNNGKDQELINAQKVYAKLADTSDDAVKKAEEVFKIPSDISKVENTYTEYTSESISSNGKVGSVKITFALKDDAKASSYDITLKTVDLKKVTDVTATTFVEDAESHYTEKKVSTLYAGEKASSDSFIVTLTGKSADGDSVNIPVAESSAVTATISEDVATAASIEGNTVSTSNEPVLDKDGNKSETTATLNLVVNNLNGDKVQIPFTVASEDPKTEAISIIGAVSGRVTEFNLGNGTITPASGEVATLKTAETYVPKLNYTDQYGYTSTTKTVDGDIVSVLFSNIPDGVDIEHNNTATPGVTVKSSDVERTITVTVTTKNGKTATANLRIAKTAN